MTAQGLAVVNGCRHLLGHAPLDEGDAGYEDLGSSVDTLFLQQLTPELAETLAMYDHVIFVDAHVGSLGEVVHRATLSAVAEPALVSHHFRPGSLLLLARELYGNAPTAELLSVEGIDFDFGSELSAITAGGVAEAVAALAASYV